MTTYYAKRKPRRCYRLAHMGYLDGVSGQDPDPESERSEEYSLGWVVGAEDRKTGVSVFFGADCCDAYVDYESSPPKLVRPRSRSQRQEMQMNQASDPK